MEKIELTVLERTSLGSGASGRYRRQGKIPAILYGHGDPKSLLVDELSIGKILKKHGGKNAILSLKVGSEEETAIIRDIQRASISRKMLHIDFQRISLTERITANIPIEIIGASEAVKEGGILITMMHLIEVECLPMEIPDSIKADISVLKAIGDSIHASQLLLPEGVILKTSPTAAVVTVQPPEEEDS